MLVYIAGPYTQGDVAVNIKNAIDAANKIADAGHYVYVPHLSHFWHMAHPRPYKFWLEQDKVILLRCDALVLVPGISPGALEEVFLAEQQSIPVWPSVESFIAAYTTRIVL